MISPCLTPSNIRYVSRAKCSNPGKGVAPPTPRCSSNWKGSLHVAFDYGRHLYLLLLNFLKHQTQFLTLILGPQNLSLYEIEHRINSGNSIKFVSFVCICPTPLLRVGCDVESILSRVQLVWIQSFPFLSLIT